MRPAQQRVLALFDTHLYSAMRIAVYMAPEQAEGKGSDVMAALQAKKGQLIAVVIDESHNMYEQYVQLDRSQGL